MDFQVGVLARYPMSTTEPLLERLDRALSAARSSNLPVIFVRLAFPSQNITIPAENLLFSPLADRPEFFDGAAEAQVHPSVKPAPGEVVLVKKRASAFCGSNLAELVSSLHVKHLVLAGVSTSGVVLSTVRDAADRDFGLTVLADACADRDEEVHRVLCTKVLPMQALVTTVDDWISTLPSPATGGDQTGSRVKK
jgi:nicotinamidase-related amidase